MLSSGRKHLKRTAGSNPRLRPTKPSYHQEDRIAMMIKSLEYLPAERVVLVGSSECDATSTDVEVSLYGHWVHVRYGKKLITSYPASSVARIEWA